MATVREVMNETLFTVSPSTTVGEAVALGVAIEVGVDLQRRRVQPRLVRERARADPRLVGVRRDVGNLRDRVADPHELGERAVRQHRAAELDLQRRDDGEQVGVARPLAVAVGRALDVRRTRTDRGE